MRRTAQREAPQKRRRCGTAWHCGAQIHDFLLQEALKVNLIAPMALMQALFCSSGGSLPFFIILGYLGDYCNNMYHCIIWLPLITYIWIPKKKQKMGMARKKCWLLSFVSRCFFCFAEASPQAFLPHLRRGGGRVIHLGTSVAHHPQKGTATQAGRNSCETRTVVIKTLQKASYRFI